MNAKSVALEAYIAKWRESTFDWIESHCVVFGAGWVEEMEGFDPMAKVGNSKGKMDAVRLISRFGSLENAVTKSLGRVSRSARFAAVGDIVLFSGAGIGAIGICNGSIAFVLGEPAGVTMAEMNEAVCCWSIGDFRNETMVA